MRWILFPPGLNDKGKNCDLLVGQRSHAFKKRGKRTGIAAFKIKEFFRRNAEVFADVEKAHHRRKIFSVFNVIDIARALSNGKTHRSCGYAFFHSKLCEPSDKLLFNQRYHPSPCLCIVLYYTGASITAISFGNLARQYHVILDIFGFVMILTCFWDRDMRFPG